MDIIDEFIDWSDDQLTEFLEGFDPAINDVTGSNFSTGNNQETDSGSLIENNQEIDLGSLIENSQIDLGLLIDFDQETDSG